MSLNQPKVFGIGFHKTATSSLAAALERLGYTVCGHIGVSHPDIADVAEDLARSKIDKYDAFQDNPWPILYKRLDDLCPGSKFILTVRPTAEWIQNVVRHFGGTSTPMREWIYGEGDPKGNEHLYIDRYEKHNREVRTYFSERSDDLLELATTEGDGWEKLCPFLGHEIPVEPFPDTNKARQRRLRRVYQHTPSWFQNALRTLKNNLR